MTRTFRVGEPVVFRMTKFSTDPGPRAKEVQPAPSGETYSYLVDKFWTVAQVDADGTLVLVTRRGKQHRVTPDDHRLRPANWWEKWMYSARFPKLEQVQQLLSMGELAPKPQPKEG